MAKRKKINTSVWKRQHARGRQLMAAELGVSEYDLTYQRVWRGLCLLLSLDVRVYIVYGLLCGFFAFIGSKAEVMGERDVAKLLNITVGRVRRYRQRAIMALRRRRKDWWDA